MLYLHATYKNMTQHFVIYQNNLKLFLKVYVPIFFFHESKAILEIHVYSILESVIGFKHNT